MPAARLERIGVQVVVELGDEAIAVGRVLVVDAAEAQPLAVGRAETRAGDGGAPERLSAVRRRRHVVVPVLVLAAVSELVDLRLRLCESNCCITTFCQK